MENLFHPSDCLKPQQLTRVTRTSLKFSLHCMQFLPTLPPSLEYRVELCAGKIARQGGCNRRELTTCGDKEQHSCLTLPPGLSIQY